MIRALYACSYVMSDATLKSLFGVDRFLAFGMQKLLTKHLEKD